MISLNGIPLKDTLKISWILKHSIPNTIIPIMLVHLIIRLSAEDFFIFRQGGIQSEIKGRDDGTLGHDYQHFERHKAFNVHKNTMEKKFKWNEMR